MQLIPLQIIRRIKGARKAYNILTGVLCIILKSRNICFDDYRRNSLELICIRMKNTTGQFGVKCHSTLSDIRDNRLLIT